MSADRIPSSAPVPPGSENIFEAHIQEAERLKTVGNQHYAEGRFQRAIGQYLRIVAYTKGHLASMGGTGEDGGFLSIAQRSQDTPSPEQTAKLSELETAAYNNAAAAALQLKDWAKATQYAGAAVGRDPTSVKARLRRATALYHQGKIIDMQTDLDQISKLTDGKCKDPTYISLVKILKQKRANDQKALAKRMQKMFVK